MARHQNPPPLRRVTKAVITGESSPPASYHFTSEGEVAGRWQFLPSSPSSRAAELKVSAQQLRLHIEQESLLLGTFIQREDGTHALTPVLPKGEWDLHAFLFVDGVPVTPGRPHLLAPGSVLESNGSAFRFSGAALSNAASAEGFARHAAVGLFELEGSRLRVRAPHLFDTSSVWAMARLAETDVARDAEVIELVPGRDGDALADWPDFLRQHLDALGPLATKVTFLSPAAGPQCARLPAISIRLGDADPIRVVEPVDLEPGENGDLEAVRLPLPTSARIVPWGTGARVILGGLGSGAPRFRLNAASQPLTAPVWFALVPGDVLTVDSGNHLSTVRVLAAADTHSHGRMRRRPISDISFDGAACENVTFQWDGGHQTVGVDPTGELRADGLPSLVAIAADRFVIKGAERSESREFTWFEALPHLQHKRLLVLPRPSPFLGGLVDPSDDDDAWQVQLDALLSLQDPAADGLVALRRPDAARVWIPRLLGEFGLLWATGLLRGEHDAGFFRSLHLPTDKTGGLLLNVLTHPLMKRVTRVELPSLGAAVHGLLPTLQRRRILLIG